MIFFRQSSHHHHWCIKWQFDNRRILGKLMDCLESDIKGCQVNFPNNLWIYLQVPNGGWTQKMMLQRVANKSIQIQQTTLMVPLWPCSVFMFNNFHRWTGWSHNKGMGNKAFQADDFALLGPEKNVTYPKFTEYFALRKYSNMYSTYVTTDTLHKRNLSKKSTWWIHEGSGGWLRVKIFSLETFPTVFNQWRTHCCILKYGNCWVLLQWKQLLR